MNLRLYPATKAVGIVALFVLLAGGCGGSDDTGPSSTTFADIEITVGSKDFTEQYVLSTIMVMALEAQGATVASAIDTGTTDITRQALLDGTIDGYFEYNATGWVEHLGQTDPDPDGEALTEAVRESDAANGITWVGRGTFNDTYGFAITPTLRQETSPSRSNNGEVFDLAAMADYLEENPDATVCVEPEFEVRDDGLVLFEQATGYKVEGAQLIVVDDAAAIYQMTDDGDCVFGEVFTTDGRIRSLDLTLVVDPGVFYVYNPSFSMRTDLYDQAPEAFDQLVADVLSPLSQDRITELNQRVSDGEAVEDVAKEYLDQFNLAP